ncbi:MAG: hypothetical protein ACPG4U_01540 [Pseudomonadales bacterium]
MQIHSHQNIQPQADSQRLSSEIGRLNADRAQRLDAENLPAVNTIIAITTAHSADGAAGTVTRSEGMSFLKGDHLDVTLPDGEHNEPLVHALLKLDEAGQKALIDSGLLDDEDGRQLIAQMEPEQLAQFAEVAKGLKQHTWSPDEKSQLLGFQVQLKRFTDQLIGVDEETQKGLLERGAQYAQSAVTHDATETYNANGKVLNKVNPASRALTDFVQAVVNVEAPSELLTTLDQFSEQQSRNLLAVYAVDANQGERAVEGLKDSSEEIRDLFLDQFAKLSYSTGYDYLGFWNSSSFDEGSALQNRYYNPHSVRPSALIDQTLELMANYDFSDEQLIALHSDSQGSIAEQKMMLDVMEVGLERLLGREEGGKTSLEGHEDVLEVLSAVRNSSAVQELMTDARYDTYYSETLEREVTHPKKQGAAMHASESVIEVMVSQAYLQSQQREPSGEDVSSFSFESLSDSVDALANQLLNLESAEQDSTVAQLRGKLGAQGPLALRDAQLLEHSLADFEHRVNALSQSGDPAKLLEAAEENSAVPADDFWRVADAFGSQVDLFATTYALLEEDEQVKLVRDLLEHLDEPQDEGPAPQLAERLNSYDQG